MGKHVSEDPLWYATRKQGDFLVCAHSHSGGLAKGAIYTLYGFLRSPLFCEGLGVIVTENPVYGFCTCHFKAPRSANTAAAVTELKANANVRPGEGA